MTSIDDFFIGLAKLGSILNKFWQYELIVIGDNIVKISNLVLAFILSLLVLSFSNNISRYVTNLLNDKLIKDKDAANIAQKMLLYLLYFILFLIILEIANIPINVFAFIGGAFAISAGLGAQNLTNNFISGLLILLEKPIKVGDVIKIGDIAGKVIHIGFRCTIIENFQGINIVVPNSEIMQNKISNWNYSNAKVKYDINIHILKTKIPVKDHKILAQQITSSLSDIGYSTHTYLLSVKSDVDIFGFSIELDSNHLNNVTEVKNAINLVLLENLKYDFSIEYPVTLL